MIIPEWAFVSVLIALLFIIGAFVLKLHNNKESNLQVEDFLMSKDPDGKHRANPHKLAFLLAFIVTTWINIVIAPTIPTSDNALFYSIAFMAVFTISVLSRSTLTVIRDIVAIVWKR